MAHLPCSQWDDLAEDPVVRPRSRVKRKFSKAVAASYLVGGDFKDDLVCSDKSQDAVRAMLLRNNAYRQKYGHIGEGVPPVRAVPPVHTEPCRPSRVQSCLEKYTGNPAAKRMSQPRVLSSIAPVTQQVLEVTDKYDKWLSVASQGHITDNTHHLSDILADMDVGRPAAPDPDPGCPSPEGAAAETEGGCVASRGVSQGRPCVLTASELRRQHNKRIYEERTLELRLLKTERRMKELVGDRAWLRKHRAANRIQCCARRFLAVRERRLRQADTEQKHAALRRKAREEHARAERRKQILTAYDAKYAAASTVQRIGRGCIGRATHRQLRFEKKCRIFTEQSNAATVIAAFVRARNSAFIRETRCCDVALQVFRVCTAAARTLQQRLYRDPMQQRAKRHQTRILVSMRKRNMLHRAYHTLGMHAHRAVRHREAAAAEALLAREAAAREPPCAVACIPADDTSPGHSDASMAFSPEEQAACVVQCAWRRASSHKELCLRRDDRALNCRTASAVPPCDLTQEQHHSVCMLQRAWRGAHARSLLAAKKRQCNQQGCDIQELFHAAGMIQRAWRGAAARLILAQRRLVAYSVEQDRRAAAAAALQRAWRRKAATLRVQRLSALRRQNTVAAHPQEEAHAAMLIQLCWRCYEARWTTDLRRDTYKRFIQHIREECAQQTLQKCGRGATARSDLRYMMLKKRRIP